MGHIQCCNYITVHHLREEQFSDRLRANANCKGCTALHYAALVDDVKTIRALLDNGRYFHNEIENIAHYCVKTELKIFVFKQIIHGFKLECSH